MKLAVCLIAVGVALMLFGMLFFTIGGPNRGPWRPSIQEVSFFAGMAIAALGVFRGIRHRRRRQ